MRVSFHVIFNPFLPAITITEWIIRSCPVLLSLKYTGTSQATLPAFSRLKLLLRQAQELPHHPCRHQPNYWNRTMRILQWNGVFPRCTVPQFLLAFLLLSVMAVPAAADLTLANKGATKYRIILSSAAIPAERYAAEELQRYLEKITG